MRPADAAVLETLVKAKGPVTRQSLSDLLELAPTTVCASLRRLAAENKAYMVAVSSEKGGGIRGTRYQWWVAGEMPNGFEVKRDTTLQARANTKRLNAAAREAKQRIKDAEKAAKDNPSRLAAELESVAKIAPSNKRLNKARETALRIIERDRAMEAKRIEAEIAAERERINSFYRLQPPSFMSLLGVTQAEVDALRE